MTQNQWHQRTWRLLDIPGVLEVYPASLLEYLRGKQLCGVSVVNNQKSSVEKNRDDARDKWIVTLLSLIE